VALAGTALPLACGRSERHAEAGEAPSGGGGVSAGGAETAGAGCVPVWALPVDTERLCQAPVSEVDVVGCARGDRCGQDAVCVIRKSDRAMFIGLGSKCFDELPQEWARCVPPRDSFPVCDGAGGA